MAFNLPTASFKSHRSVNACAAAMSRLNPGCELVISVLAVQEGDSWRSFSWPGQAEHFIFGVTTHSAPGVSNPVDSCYIRATEMLQPQERLNAYGGQLTIKGIAL